jgi:hypothetical protein
MTEIFEMTTTTKIDPETVAEMLDDDLLLQINAHDPYDVEFVRRYRALAARVAEVEAARTDMARVSVGHAIDAAYGLRAWEHWMKRAEAAEAKLAEQETANLGEWKNWPNFPTEGLGCWTSGRYGIVPDDPEDTEYELHYDGIRIGYYASFEAAQAAAEKHHKIAHQAEIKLAAKEAEVEKLREALTGIKRAGQARMASYGDEHSYYYFTASAALQETKK